MKCLCPECGKLTATLTADGVQCTAAACGDGSFSDYVESNIVTPKATTSAPTPPPPAPFSREEEEEEDYDSYGDYGYEEEEEEDEDDDDYGYNADNEWDGRDGRSLEHIRLLHFVRTPRLNTIEIKFALGGEPGHSDKRVEFLFHDDNPQYKRNATLSNRRKTYVDGVDADGRTIYKTHWKCKNDGYTPERAMALKLEARVF